jgi:uncharacterized protein YggE
MMLKIIIFILLGIANLLANEEYPQKTIEVMGVCYENVLADTFQITINISSESPNPESANTVMYKKHNEVIAKIKATNLKNYTLETAKVSTDIVYKDNTSTYVSRANINFSSNNKKDIKYVAGLVAKEKQSKTLLIYYSNYAYGFSKNLLNTVRLNCLDIAQQDAKAKAKTLAQGNGFILGDIIKISEEKTPEKTMYYTNFKFKNESSNTMINLETLETQDKPLPVTTEIFVTFTIK